MNSVTITGRLGKDPEESKVLPPAARKIMDRLNRQEPRGHCFECGHIFTETEDIHTNSDGADVCERCCDRKECRK